MKVSREQAAANRERVVEAAGRLFRENGFDGVSIVDLMNAAGLSHGGFYNQFESKGDLAAEACVRALAGSVQRWQAVVARRPEAPLAAIAEHYLSERHREDPGGGCVYASLAAEAGRQGQPAVKRAFTEGLQPLLAILERHQSADTDEGRRAAALVAMSTMVGALVLARAVDDKELSDALLAAGRAAVASGENAR